MRPGDLVEFKSGTFNIKAPHNAGLYLDRIKRKGDYWVVLFTVEGRKEFHRDRVGRVLLSQRLPDQETADDELLRGRLRQALGEVTSGSAEASGRVAEEARDRDLWQKLDGSGAETTVADLARAFFRVPEPRPHQLEAIREVLRSCERPGVGYFERLHGPGERWKPLSRDEHRRITADREGLSALRNRLVRTEEVEEEGRLRTKYTGVAPADAALSPDDQARLDFARDMMADFILHDRYTSDWGLGGTKVHTIDGWRLHDHLRFMAHDWTGSRASVSSAFVEFLLGVGLWTPGHALQTVARRTVALSGGSFQWELDAPAVRESDRLPPDVTEEEKQGRHDLRAQECYTIDPSDAKDHDDAVAADRHPDGTWTLWVHIADVGHYVRPGTSIDRAARDRATSLYLPTGVLPMLPPRLSEDLCSLKAGKDRLALTAEIRLDADGRVQEERFHEAVIRVRANATYEEALEAMTAGRQPFASMAELARRMGQQRRGLELETGEVRVRLTEEELTHHVKFGNAATKMIEVFMVAANEAVARHLTSQKLPALYRCHPLPDRSAIDRFNTQMKTMELAVRVEPPPLTRPEEEAGPEPQESVLDMLRKGGSITLVRGGVIASDQDEAPKPPDQAPALIGLAQLTPEEAEAWLAPFRHGLEVLRAVSDVERRDVTMLKMLGCMGRAFYTPDNLGHFGLGSTCYCHFTSPIRRYPDLVIHRQLRAALRREGAPHTIDELRAMADHCSNQGALADDTERKVTGVALLLVDRSSGRTWPRPGVVNGVTKGAVYVSLGQGLEARVLASDIPGGPWSVDAADSRLFIGSLDRPELAMNAAEAGWRDVFDEELGEVVRVRLRLGDRLPVVNAGFDYVDGRVAAKPGA